MISFTQMGTGYRVKIHHSSLQYLGWGTNLTIPIGQVGFSLTKTDTSCIPNDIQVLII